MTSPPSASGQPLLTYSALSCPWTFALPFPQDTAVSTRVHTVVLFTIQPSPANRHIAGIDKHVLEETIKQRRDGYKPQPAQEDRMSEGRKDNSPKSSTAGFLVSGHKVGNCRVGLPKVGSDQMRLLNPQASGMMSHF